MYKYLGLGLMALVAVLMIPAHSAESFAADKPSMYGMAVLSVLDSSGNTMMTNTVHNIIVDQATSTMIAAMFQESGDLTGAAEANQADGICLTDASDFGVSNAITSTTFATDGGTGSDTNDLDGATGNSCILLSSGDWTVTAISASSGTVNFAAGDTNVVDGTTITGFAVCDVAAGLDNCETGSDLVAVIATSVTLGTGETVDITYVMNLD